MKLRTIILFAVVAGIFSFPLLKNPPLSKAKAPFENVPTQYGVYENAVAKQPAKTQGFLSRIFGGSSASKPQEPGPSAQTGSFYQNAPYGSQYSQSTSGIPSTHTGGIPTQSISFSEPVYTAFFNLGEFLRFDLTPQWVRQKWPRVSVIQGPDKLTGMRVAVVSGPRPADISGSLTYFFDDQQRIQRICFKGWTGDGTELTQVAQQLGLQRRKSNAAALFTKKSWGKPKGALRLDYPPVIQQELPNQQLMVLFEFVNPSSSLSLSEPTQAILTAMENGR